MHIPWCSFSRSEFFWTYESFCILISVKYIILWYFCYLQTARPVYRPLCPACLTGPCVLCLPPVLTSPAVSKSLSWTERLRFNWLWTALIMNWGHKWTRYPGDSLWLATALGHRRFSVFKGSISFCKYHITFYMLLYGNSLVYSYLSFFMSTSAS